MGTNVRKWNGGREKKMAFTCVLYLKEECDGCGMCEKAEERAWRE